MRLLASLIVLACLQRNLLATSCSVPAPCARVHTNSILFIGVVVDAGVAAGTKTESTRDVHLQVDEAFTGLPANAKEVVVRTEGSWLEKGHRYLIDAGRGDDNRLYPTICGTSDEASSPYVTDVLEYLRQRAQGKAKTSLTVRVTDQYKPVTGVDVTLSGPGVTLRGRTGENGIATFKEIKPAKYRVAGSRIHYHLDAASDSDDEVEVLAGTCPSAWVRFHAEAVVSGFARDATGKPVASLDLELVTAPENPSQEVSLNKPFFEAKTDGYGRFVFESVSPGRYFLGSNVIGLNTSSVPPTYYPGQLTRNGAVPIEVDLGETVDNLSFILPDFGKSREIQLCVLDENGKPAASVGITSTYKTGGDFARLGERLITDQTGCIKARGYARAAYSVHAILSAGDIRQTRISDSIVINPGEDPVYQVLVLKRLIGSPNSKQ